MRTLLAVPLRKDGTLLGFISAFRVEVRPFSENEIAVLESFAAQAVIAIENARLLTEQREALEQQTATAEVLQVINASPGDLVPVFDAMLEKAVRLCESSFGILATYDGECLHNVATRGVPPALADFLREPIRPTPGTSVQRIVHGADVVHVADIIDDEAYRSGVPGRRALVDLGGGRSQLVVALRRDDTLLGLINVYRQEPRPFSEKQIALLQNFAAQAVIAMENARLLAELRQRTGDLQELLEYQTATSDVLKVISRSTFDLPPVLQTLLATAARLCDADLGAIAIREGDAYRMAASYNPATPEYDAFFRGRLMPTDRGSVTGRTVLEGRIVHVADVMSDPEFALAEAVKLGGARTVLGVPLWREGGVAGVIILGRVPVLPFTDRQIELVSTFADQAVIAIENTRLLTEQQEALEQQTATADVLQVINASPGNLAPVFDAMLEKAIRLCESQFGIFNAYDGEYFHAAAAQGISHGLAEYLRTPFRAGPGVALYRIVQGEDVVHIADITDDDAYRLGDPGRRAVADLGGARSQIIVALRKDGTLLGAINIFRQEVRPFSDKQIALLQNFAAQAVIAMESARLLTEQREALEQQTATAEVLQVINASPGSLTPVFDAMLEKATRLCEAACGQLATYDGEHFKFVAVHGEANFVQEQRGLGLLSPSVGVTWPPIVAGELAIHLPDVRETELYRNGHEGARRFVDNGGGRSLLSVALRKDEVLLGVLSIYRQEPRRFLSKQIALLENFAAQAVIAMENARLLTEQREALEQQTATAEVLQVINASPGNLTPVFDAILEKAHSLCGAAMGALATYDGAHFRAVATRGYTRNHDAAIRQPFAPNNFHQALLRGERLSHVADIRAVDIGQHAISRSVIENTNMRTFVTVPLRKDGVLLGFISAWRVEVRPFSEKEIALLENFAAQAVIAMENARLLGELRQRTSDLEESLEYQTATSDVLKVISRSTFDLQPVLDTLVQTAARLCEADFATISTRDGVLYQAVAIWSGTPEFGTFIRGRSFAPNRTSVTGRTVLEGQVVHVADLTADPEYAVTEAVTLGGVRTLLGVPLLREGQVVGVINLGRMRVEPFTDRQIELVRTFADQAVIAIENVAPADRTTGGVGTADCHRRGAAGDQRIAGQFGTGIRYDAGKGDAPVRRRVRIVLHL